MSRTPTLRDPARFGQAFVEAYLRPGLGRMSKRDVDVLVLHLLDSLSDIGTLDDWDAARHLGTTPTRIRGLRADARYVLTDVEQQDRWLHDAFFRALDDELTRPGDGGRVAITLTDPFVRDGIKALCAAHGKVADVTVNRDQLLLSKDAFAQVCAALLTPEEQAVIARCAADARWFPPDTPWETLRRAATDAQGHVKPDGIATLVRMALGDLGAVRKLLSA